MEAKTELTARVLQEAGYQPALYGMSLSHSLDNEYGDTTEAQLSRSKKLAHKQGGHNKFLESIMVWIEVKAPRYWWQQADTYRVSTKQSESTMHTLTKMKLDSRHFADDVPREILDELNRLIETKNFGPLKNLLPEGFLQKRVWLVSYKTLQNIIYQRRSHRLPEWQDFILQVLEQVEHPDFLNPSEA